MGRGEGSSAGTAIASPRRARLGTATTEEAPEMFWGERKGNVSIRIYNRYRITPDDYEMLFQLHKAGVVDAARTKGDIDDVADTDQAAAVYARDVAARIPGLTGAEVSKALRRLADAGHVEIDDGSSKGLRFKGLRDISEYFQCTACVPTLLDRKRPGASLAVMTHASGDSIMLWKEPLGEMYVHGVHVNGPAFSRRLTSLARHVINGDAGDQVVMIDAGTVPSGEKQAVVAAPFRFKKGRKQEPMIAMKTVIFSDGGASVKLDDHGSVFERPYQHVLRARDVLDLCKVIDDPVEAARPARGH